MLYTGQFLQENNVTVSITEPMFGKYTKTISIPKHFILMERVKSKCSLSEGEIIQEAIRCLMGIESKSRWESDNPTYSIHFKCDPSITDTHRIYKFTMKEEGGEL